VSDFIHLIDYIISSSFYFFLLDNFVYKKRQKKVITVISLNIRLSSFSKRVGSYTKAFPCGETLEFTVIINLKLFFVTNASIIKIDFSKKFYNFYSTKNKSLRYQYKFIYFEISVNSLNISTLSK